MYSQLIRKNLNIMYTALDMDVLLGLPRTLVWRHQDRTGIEHVRKQKRKRPSRGTTRRPTITYTKQKKIAPPTPLVTSSAAPH